MHRDCPQPRHAARSDQNRRWLLAGSTATALLTIATAWLASGTAVTRGAANAGSRPASVVQQGLQRIVAIRQQQLDRYRVIQTGTRSLGTMDEATVNLLEAQARLAQARGDDRDAQDKLRQIVSVRQRRRQQLENVHNSPPDIKERAEQQLYEAEHALALASGNTDQARRKLDQIVALNQRQLERIRLRQSQDREDTYSENAELRLLESQVRVAEFQLAAEQQSRK